MSEWVRFECSWIDDRALQITEDAERLRRELMKLGLATKAVDKLAKRARRWPDSLLFAYLRREQHRLCRALDAGEVYELPSTSDVQRVSGRGRGALYRLLVAPEKWWDESHASTWRLAQSKGLAWRGTQRERRGNAKGTEGERENVVTETIVKLPGNAKGTQRERRGNAKGNRRVGDLRSTDHSFIHSARERAPETQPPPDLESVWEAYSRIRTAYLRGIAEAARDRPLPPSWRPVEQPRDLWEEHYGPTVEKHGETRVIGVLQWAAWSDTRRAQMLRMPDRKYLVTRTLVGSKFPEYAALAEAEGYPVPWPDEQSADVDELVGRVSEGVSEVEELAEMLELDPGAVLELVEATDDLVAEQVGGTTHLRLRWKAPRVVALAAPPDAPEASDDFGPAEPAGTHEEADSGHAGAMFVPRDRVVSLADERTAREAQATLDAEEHAAEAVRLRTELSRQLAILDLRLEDLPSAEALEVQATDGSLDGKNFRGVVLRREHDRLSERRRTLELTRDAWLALVGSNDARPDLEVLRAQIRAGEALFGEA
jgi:hypothetical protein